MTYAVALEPVIVPAGDEPGVRAAADRVGAAARQLAGLESQLRLVATPVDGGRWWGLGAGAAVMTIQSCQAERRRAAEALEQMQAALRTYANELGAALDLARATAAAVERYNADVAQTRALDWMSGQYERAGLDMGLPREAVGLLSDVAEAEWLAREAARRAVAALDAVTFLIPGMAPPPEVCVVPPERGRDPILNDLADLASLVAAIWVPPFRAGLGWRFSASGALRGAARPLAFSSAKQYDRFVLAFRSGLDRAGYPRAQIGIRGSSVTGVRHKDGTLFDTGELSDLDLVVIDEGLLRMLKGEVKLRGAGTRTGPLNETLLRNVGLDGVLPPLSDITGRKVTIMVYSSAEAVGRRGSDFIVMGVP